MDRCASEEEKYSGSSTFFEPNKAKRDTDM